MTADSSLIHVVDDDPAMRASLESLLRSVGHDVLCFETAQAFAAAARPDRPGCLVLDVRLPGLSGLEFQRELGRSANPLPIVFITGHGDVPMAVAALKAGAVEFLTKPFRDQDLLDAIQQGIALARLRRALGELIVDGVETTVPLFDALLAEPDIQNGEYNIHWLEKWLEKQFG